MPTITRTTHIGTIDELEPVLRSLGFTAAITMAGPVDLATWDPYGARRVGSINIQSERWAHHVYRGCLAYVDGKPYIVDAKEPEPPFLGGMFPLA